MSVTQFYTGIRSVLLLYRRIKLAILDNNCWLLADRTVFNCSPPIHRFREDPRDRETKMESLEAYWSCVSTEIPVGYTGNTEHGINSFLHDSSFLVLHCILVWSAVRVPILHDSPLRSPRDPTALTHHSYVVDPTAISKCVSQETHRRVQSTLHIGH